MTKEAGLDRNNLKNREFGKAAETREGPEDLRSAEQVSESEPARRAPQNLDSERATIAERLRKHEKVQGDLRSAEQVSESELGPKGGASENQDSEVKLTQPKTDSSDCFGMDRKLQNRAVLGVLLMIAALSVYPLSDAFFKHLMGTYSVHQTSFLRAVTRLLPLLIATLFQGGPLHILRSKYPSRHLLRLGVNLAFTYSFMYAFSMGSLTVIYTLSYTSPLFMVLLSAWMLKEKVSRERWAAVIVGIIGVIIAMRPGSNVLEMTAILVLIGTFLGALNKILMRRLAETEHSLAIAIYPNIAMILVTFPFLLGSWQSMPWSDWGLFATVGIITAGGQYCIAQALRFTQASVLAPIDYSTFAWVVMLDFFWWHKSLDLYTLAGAVVIVGSNLFILYTQVNSRVGNLARRRRQFLRPEQATIAEWQGASEDQKFAAKPTTPKTNS